MVFNPSKPTVKANGGACPTLSVSAARSPSASAKVQARVRSSSARNAERIRLAFRPEISPSSTAEGRVSYRYPAMICSSVSLDGRVSASFSAQSGVSTIFRVVFKSCFFSSM